jgi:hypothetical protein
VMVRSLVQRKYDKDSKLWIPDYYVLYAYWYRFLQIAVEENRDIDWEKYEGWGGPEVIQNTKFRKWWLENWKELFGVRTELLAGHSSPYVGVTKSSRRFHLSTNRPKRNGIKVALRVYENKHRGNSLYIYDFLRTKYADSVMGSLNGYASKAQSIKERNRTVKRYMSQAEKHLDNVCVGKFP